MNTKVWYLYHTRMIETCSNVNAHMVRRVHTMLANSLCCGAWIYIFMHGLRLMKRCACVNVGFELGEMFRA